MESVNYELQSSLLQETRKGGVKDYGLVPRGRLD